IMPGQRGDFYLALIEKPGRPAIEVIAEIVAEVVKTFPWPKSMRWGEQSQQPGSLAWVRPLHSIVATFGPETEEPEIVPFAIDGIKAGDETHGHRFMAPQPFKVRRFEDYVAKLEKAKVVLDPERRKEMILADAKNLAFAQGYELVEDAGLLAEVAGLVEWPVVMIGSFDDAFLRMPPEIVRATIRNNQKCFVLREERTSELAPKVGADVETLSCAARLAKADLLTEVVGEFPGLKGVMGKYYAVAQGDDPSVAAACEEHYKPLGPADRVPTAPVSVAIALADKIDVLVGFWAIDEKPTGSKD